MNGSFSDLQMRQVADTNNLAALSAMSNWGFRPLYWRRLIPVQVFFGRFYEFRRHLTSATSILQTVASGGLRKPVPNVVKIVPSGKRTVEVD